jgi:hypothetical protein
MLPKHTVEFVELVFLKALSTAALPKDVKILHHAHGLDHLPDHPMWFGLHHPLPVRGCVKQKGWRTQRDYSSG